MKIALLTLLLFAVGLASCLDEYPYLQETPIQWPNDTQEAFALFKNTFNKVYSADENLMRYQIFQANLARARQYDAASLREASHRSDKLASLAARYGITKFSDLTPTEFRDRYLTSDPLANGARPSSINSWAPSNISVQNLGYDRNCVSGHLYDWNICHFVTGVYNQGDCGSCWAFSTTEQLESMWAIAGHGLRHLAMQQLVSCDRQSDGCGGGSPGNAWEYIRAAGGQDSLESYPYSQKYSL